MEPIFIASIIIIAIFIAVMAMMNGKERKPKRNKDEFYKEQEQRVKIGGYKKQKLLNNTEDVSRAAIIKVLENKGSNKRLYAQVSLGEILKHENYKLYKDIQSKRADFVITDNKNNPEYVIEIHGAGHYRNKTTTKRDEIKKLAIEDAGIKYLAIAVGNSPKQIYAEVINKVKDFI